jgi:tRNA modification GTPase
MDMLIETALSLGARLARPGEFTERAFLNDKIDLVQAEAIADLIDAGSREAARCAAHSLQGEFSKHIHNLTEALITLRIYVEAAIDFPEEEIDFLADERIAKQLHQIEQDLEETLAAAQQGSLMREGIHAVIVGKPNAGKSSLLNALAGEEAAIVTHIEGTTRDVLRQQVQIDGIPVHVTDTAGIRKATDTVEQIGIDRAIKEIEKADLILLVVDASEQKAEDIHSLWPKETALPDVPVIMIRNKIDLTNEKVGVQETETGSLIRMSAKHQDGLNELKALMKKIVGYQEQMEGRFIARRRHLEALNACVRHLELASDQLKSRAGELVAEELRICQNHLSEITGEFTSDDLLGRIFTSFCIGK